MTPAALKQLENDLWATADTLSANSDLRSSDRSRHILDNKEGEQQTCRN